MKDKEQEVREPYEAPRIVALGSVHELTLWHPCTHHGSQPCSHPPVHFSA